MGGKGFWRRWRYGRARPAIIAGAVLLTLLGLLAGAVFAQASYRQASAQVIMQRDRQVAQLTAIRLGDELLKLADELQPTARSQSLYLGLTDKQRLFLREQTQRLSVFDGGVILMDNTGRVRATVPERWDIMSTDWSNQEFFKRMLINPPPAQYFSSILNVGPENSPVIVVSVPVLGENGAMVGVLAGLFRLGESRVSAFYASIIRLRLPGTGNTYIVDSNGRIVYDSGYQRTGQTVDLASMQEKSKTENPEPALDAEGNEVISSWAPIPGTNWGLVTETDWAQAIAPVERLATGIIVLLALGMVVPTVGVALLARGQRSGARDADQALFEARIAKTMRARLLPHYTPMLAGWEVAVHHQAGNVPTGSVPTGSVPTGSVPTGSVPTGNVPTAAKGATARDLYDFMLLPDGRLMIALATVAEPGLAAVHLLTTARAAFRTAACHAQSAGHALAMCNNLLCPDVGPSTAITSLFALLDPTSGRLQVANAGFCAPFHWSGGGGSQPGGSQPGGSQPGGSQPVLIEMREGADFLGQSLDVQFDHDDVLVGPSDAMIFYSPGALGVRPETGDPFGPERVRRVLNESGATTAQGMVDALQMDLAEFADAKSLRRLDVTFLVLSRAPASPTAEKPGRSLRGRTLRDELAALGETETDL